MKTSNEVKFLSPEEKQELLEAMDIHFQTHLRARSLTPYIHISITDHVSSNQPGGFFLISSSPLYQDYGYSSHIIFKTSQFDTEEKYRQYQDIQMMASLNLLHKCNKIWSITKKIASRGGFFS
ncbi:hypothetical protein DSECCO2_637630 [anaerobic digester metagenome]